MQKQKPCECDVDFHCANHDVEAEAAYWAGLYYGARPAETGESLAYESGDPKAFRWEDADTARDCETV